MTVCGYNVCDTYLKSTTGKGLILFGGLFYISISNSKDTASNITMNRSHLTKLNGLRNDGGLVKGLPRQLN